MPAALRAIDGGMGLSPQCLPREHDWLLVKRETLFEDHDQQPLPRPVVIETHRCKRCGIGRRR